MRTSKTFLKEIVDIDDIVVSRPLLAVACTRYRGRVIGCDGDRRIGRVHWFWLDPASLNSGQVIAIRIRVGYNNDVVVLWFNFNLGFPRLNLDSM